MEGERTPEPSAYDRLSPQHRRFVDLYVGRTRFNQTKAYIGAGYSRKSAYANAHRLMENDGVREAIREKLRKRAMTDEEAAHIIGEQARGTLRPFVRKGPGGRLVLDTSQPGAIQALHLVKKWKQKERVLKAAGEDGEEEEIKLVEIETEVELYSAQAAAHMIRQAHGAYGAKGTPEDPVITEVNVNIRPPRQAARTAGET